jgi:glutamate synthase domain-containing protein 2
MALDVAAAGADLTLVAGLPETGTGFWSWVLISEAGYAAAAHM